MIDDLDLEPPTDLARVREPQEPQGPAMPAGEGPMTRFLREHAEQVNREAVASFARDAEHNPDLAGEAQRLAVDTRLDADVVRRNIDKVRLIRAREARYENFAALHSPVLRAQLLDPEFAALAHDKELGFWDGVSASWDVGFLSAARANLGSTMRTRKLTNAEAQRLDWINRRLEALPRTSGTGIASFFRASAKLAGQQASSVVDATTWGLGYATVAGAAGAAGPQIVAEPLTVGAAFGLGFTMSMLQSAHNQEAGNQYLELLDMGVDATTARLYSGYVGVINAGFESLTGFGVSKALGLTKGLAQFLPRNVVREQLAASLVRPTLGKAAAKAAMAFAEHVGGEVTTEVAQEITSILAENAAIAASDPSKLTLEHRQAVGQRLIDIAVETAKGMTLFGAVGAGRTYLQGARAVKRAETQQAFVRALARGDLKAMAKSAPAPLESVLHRMQDGAPTENLYVAADALHDLLRETDTSREQLRAVAPEVERQLDTAAAVGGSVAVPTALWETRFGGTPLADGILQHSRIDPEGSSAREVEQLSALLQEQKDTAEQALEAVATQGQLFEESARRVEEAFRDQVAATGRANLGRAQAAELAKLYRAVVERGTIDEQKRTPGITPEQWQERFGVRVAATRDAVQAPADEAALQRVTESPEFKAWFGDSKVVDDAGKPLVVYHGTTATKPGRYSVQAGDSEAKAARQAMAARFGLDSDENLTGAIKNALQLQVYATPELAKATEADLTEAEALAKRARGRVTRNPDALAFDAFDLPAGEHELGAHFGTEQQAKGFGPTFKFYLSLRNLLRLPDLGTWNYQSVIREARKQGVNITEADYDAVFNAPDANTALRELLLSKGIDGIVYANKAEGRGDSYIALRPEQIKSVDNRGTFDPNDPNILHRVAGPILFYSALAREIDALSVKSTDAAGWKQAVQGLVNKGRVKPAEVEWTGLNDWLDLQEDKIAKDQVTEFLRANGVQVETVTLGSLPADAKARVQARLQDVRIELSRVQVDASELSMAWKTRLRAHGLNQLDLANVGWWFVELTNEDARAKTKIERLKLTDADHAAGLELAELRRRESELQIQAADLHNELSGRAGDRAKFESYTIPGGTNYREVLLTLPRGNLKGTEPYGARLLREAGAYDFRSAHFDEKNPVAHIRLNDRTDAQGRRVLFVEELQSDWGQKGRDQGFATRRQEWVVRAKYRGKVVDIARSTESQEKAESLIDPAWRESEGVTLETEVNDLGFGPGVPRAPFVENTKGWLSLAIKRVLMLAVEGGYDSVAFIDGETSAERYDLSKQVREIEYIKHHDGFELGVTGVDGEGIDLPKNRYTAEELSDVVGKDLAQKMVSGEGRQYRGHAGITLEGVDLKVGGEGMRKFYDEVVPNTARDVVKKLGGAVGDVSVTLEGATVARPGVEITDKLRASVEPGLPLFARSQTEDLGEYLTRLRAIVLHKNATVSTVSHELGHFAVEDMLRIARSGGAADDLNVLLAWVGVRDVSAWDQLSAAERAKHHETIAYSFEGYMLDGRAPTQELETVFARLRRWVLAVYAKARDALNATYRSLYGEDLPMLTPEVRSVFDRLLASQQAIDAAEQLRNMVPLFTTEAEFTAQGGTAEQWAEYQASIENAREGAVTKVVRSLKLRETMARAKEVRASFEAEETATVEQEPIYAAEQQLRHGTVADDAGAQQRLQLDLHTVQDLLRTIAREHGAVDEAAEKTTAAALQRKLGTGSSGMLRAGGFAPDLVASILGFADGETLVRQLVDTPPLAERVAQQVEARMAAEHPELADPAAIDETVNRALNSADRARQLAGEIRALSGSKAPVHLMVAAAKQAAKDALQRRTVRTLNPAALIGAEAREARMAAEALVAGDQKKALQHKRAQLLHNQLLRVAFDADKDVQQALRDFADVTRNRSEERMAKTRRMDLVQAARWLLGRFELASEKVAGRAAEYLRQIEAYDPGLFSTLAPMLVESSSRAQSYKDLTLGEFLTLRDAVVSLWKRSSREKQIATQDGLVDLADVVDEILPVIPKPRAPGAGRLAARTRGDQRAHELLGLRASFTRVEHWARWIDGGTAGPITKWIVRPMLKAVANYRDAAAGKLGELLELIDGLKADRQLIAAPRLNYTFGNGNGGFGILELLGAVLHTGNSSNLDRMILNGRGPGFTWGEVLDDGVTVDRTAWDLTVRELIDKGTLTEAHFDWAQKVWDLLEGLLPEIQKTNNAVFGRYVTQVPFEGFSVTFKDGKTKHYRGGYVPAAADVHLAPRRTVTAEQIEAEARESFPSIDRSFVKERTKGNRPLALDVRQIAVHVDKVHMFVHVQPALRDVMRIVQDGRVAQAFDAADKNVIDELLMPWLTRTASQQLYERGRFALLDRFWKFVRTNTATAVMFLKLTNAAQQVTGLANALVYVPKGAMLRGLFAFLRHPVNQSRIINDKSQFMRQRSKSELFEVRGRIQDLLEPPTAWNKALAWQRQHAYVLQSAVQTLVDRSVWLAAYNDEASRSVADETAEQAEARAIAHADSTVRLSQGSSNPEDVAAYDAGTPWHRVWTQFTGYLSTVANTIAGERGKAARLHAALVAFTIPAIASEILMQALRSDEPDKREPDGFLAGYWGQVLVGSQLRGAAGMWPGFGPTAVAAVDALWTGRPGGDRLAAPPAVATLTRSLAGLLGVLDAAIDEDRDASPRKIQDAFTAVTILTGLPLATIGRGLRPFLEQR